MITVLYLFPLIRSTFFYIHLDRLAQSVQKKEVKNCEKPPNLKASHSFLFRMKNGYLIMSTNLQRLPQRIDIAERIGVEVLIGKLVIALAEIVDAGIEDGDGLLAQLHLIFVVLVNQGVRRGVVDVLGVRDRGLLGEHVVDEDLRELLVLAAGRDAHRGWRPRRSPSCCRSRP